jgi:hypothetical protein
LFSDLVAARIDSAADIVEDGNVWE